MDYHTERLFSKQGEKVKAANGNAFGTGLFQNNETIFSELNSTVSRGVKKATRNMPADSSIRQATRSTLELKSFAENIAHHIVENNKVGSLLATWAKHPVNKAIGNWFLRTGLPNRVDKLLVQRKYVVKASKQTPRVHVETSWPLYDRSW